MTNDKIILEIHRIHHLIGDKYEDKNDKKTCQLCLPDRFLSLPKNLYNIENEVITSTLSLGLALKGPLNFYLKVEKAYSQREGDGAGAGKGVYKRVQETEPGQ